MFCHKKNDNKKINAIDNSEEIKLPIESFFFSDESTEFYIEFEMESIIYHYELDIKKSGIQRELFIRNKKSEHSKDVVFIERVNDKIIKNIAEYEELNKVKLKEDQSIISLVSDFKFKSELIDLIRLNEIFDRFYFNVGVYGLIKERDDETIYNLSLFYKNNADALEFIKKVIISSDDGINDILIKKMKDNKGDDIYFPVFKHIYKNEVYNLIYPDESMGTKVLFNVLFKYWLVLKNGGLLIVDEFDIHLHAMILPELIELFTDLSINNKGAQLIFTAHNTEIIDDLGRYRTILVNKKNNESYCYRLDDIPLLRNDRAISPFYRKGRIGGVPILSNKNGKNIN